MRIDSSCKLTTERRVTDDSSADYWVAAVAAALLLIFTAWGNALAMFTFSSLGLIVGLLFYRQNISRGGALAAAVGFVLALGIALLKLMS